jgi:hypothetical protein
MKSVIEGEGDWLCSAQAVPRLPDAIQGTQIGTPFAQFAKSFARRLLFGGKSFGRSLVLIDSMGLSLMAAMIGSINDDEGEQDVSGRECRELWPSDSTRLRRRRRNRGGQRQSKSASAGGPTSNSLTQVAPPVDSVESKAAAPNDETEARTGGRASERACEEARPCGHSRSRVSRLAGA